VDADTAFHASLVRRFRTHRDLLRGQVDSHTGNPDTQSISPRHLLGSPPNGLQLAELDYDSTFELLAEVTQLVQQPGSYSVMQLKRLGAWVWALLAKVDELGTLSSEEVGFVRELGKAAIEVIRRRVMGEDGVAEKEIKKHERDDAREVGRSSFDGGGDRTSIPATAYHVSAVPADDVNRGRSVKARPLVRRRNSSSDASAVSVEHSPQHAVRSTASRPEQHEQEDLEIARMRLLERVAATASNEGGLAKASVEGDSAEQEDGEVIEGVNSEEDNVVEHFVEEVGFPEEADEVEEEQKLKQMNAMLVMILTIVGEEYGQRDLLVARDVLWDV
jgi:hypothetical protein